MQLINVEFESQGKAKQFLREKRVILLFKSCTICADLGIQE